MKRGFTKALALLLALVMLVGILPVSVLAANDDTDYLFIATDRHTNTSIIGNVINNMESYIGENELDYLALGGDMVGSGNSHPAYNSSTVLGEVTGATSSLSAANVDIVAGIHDMNVTDDAGIVLPYQGGGARIYEGDRFYVYGVEEYCISEDSNESNWSSEAQKFVTWANGSDIDKSKVIVVVSHYPLHAKRNDNDGAYYWHQALNTVATGAASGDSTVERNILFFHGHNHTVDSREYVYNVGDTMSIQNGSSTASETIYYTYATAGYLNQNSKATLVTITDKAVSLTKYSTSGSGTAMTSVDRVAEAAPTLSSIAVSGTTEYTVGGNGLDLTVTASYDDGTTKDVTADATFAPSELTASGVYTVTASYGGMTDTIDVTVTLYEEVLNDYGDLLVAVEAFSQGATALAVAWDDDAGAVLEAKGLYTDYVVYDLALTNPGETTEYAMSLVENMDTANLAVYHVADDGTLTLVNHKIENDCVVFTTSLTGTFAYGSLSVPEGYTLTSVTLENIPTDLFVGGTLDLMNAVITATYTKEGAENYVRQLTVYDYGETNFSGYDVNVAGDQTAVFTYEGVTATLDIHVWGHSFTKSGVTVALDSEKGAEYGVSAANVTESTNANVAAAVADVMKEGTYVAYDITLTYSENYAATEDTKTVTLPIPENVTKPAVYYVSPDGATVTNMGAKDNGDGTVTFTTTHFSTYVIGESTEITVPDPTVAVVEGASSSTTAYVLTNSLTANGEYLIVNINSTGDGYALLNNSGSVGSAAVEVKESNGSYYIELDNSNAVWTATTKSSGFELMNGSYYLEAYGSTSKLYIHTDREYSNRYWVYSSNKLYYDGGSGDHAIQYSSNTFSSTKSSATIYIYEKQSLSTSVSGTYSIAGNPAEVTKVVVEGTTATLGSTLTFVPKSGTTTTTDTSTTATYTVVDGGDPNGIISGISGNTVTFTGKTGKALVKVSYTVTVNGTDYTVDNYIVITATGPYYTIDLCKRGTDDEDNITYESITKPVALKGVKAGDTYSVWAVVKEHNSENPDGEDLGDLEDAALTWSVSDTSIASIDPATGVITFTGTNYGTFEVTVSYKGSDGKVITDTITISATESLYVVPGDGTDDFPEYPNQGAIRFDKTATAVGNFSQTGIAKVELSMTGVPYGTNAVTDVVIMVDMTASMEDNDVTAAENAVKAMIEALVYDEVNDVYDTNYQIFLDVFYSASKDDSFETETYFDGITIGNEAELTEALGKIDFSQSSQGGGTRYNLAMKDVYDTLMRDGHAEKQFAVFVSDGVATAYAPLTNGALGTTITGQNSTENSLAAGWFDDDGEVTDEFETEYYSYLIKTAGIPMYTVGANLTALSDAADVLNHMSSNYSPDGKTATGETKYSFFCTTNSTDSSAYEEIFAGIAASIREAATDVVVEDKVGEDYTLNFSFPSGVTADEAGMDEFYIQVLEYQLDENKERTGDPEVLENFTFNNDGTLKSHTVKGVACESCTHVTTSGGTITKIEGTYFNYEVKDDGEYLTWTADKLSTTELALEYFVYLDNSAGKDADEQVSAGTYYTNEYATITYTNFKGEQVQQEFPIPQMTWNGAQVTYVFYLVNEAGQPVNRAGRVIPFAEAIYVTDPVTFNVTWNEETGTENILAQNIFAEAGVPDVFALYDTSAYYEIRVYQTEGVDEATKAVNYNYFAINGSETDLTSYNTTKVFNTKAGTKYDAYGVYSAQDVGTELNTTDAAGDPKTVTTTVKATDIDYANTTVAFAVVWKPELAPDTVVVDYGLDVVIDVIKNDNMAAGVVGVRTDKPDAVINSGTYGAEKKPSVGIHNAANTKIGTASVENLNQVRFSLDKTDSNGMQFSEPTVFYYEADVNYYDEDGVLQTASMYSSVTVIPATSIYYEDGFVSYANSTVATETYGKWGQVGSEISATQDQDRPGESQISADLDADNIYGYDSAYENCTQYSLGGAQMVTVDAATGTRDTAPEATFTFTGTAFDIISLTDSDSGVIMVTVTDADGKQVARQTVDNYYGYDFYAYYQTVYTYTETKDEEGNTVTDEEGNAVSEWVGKTTKISKEAMGTSETRPSNPAVGATYTEYGQGMWVEAPGDEAIWQVPVIKMDLETYGTYTVTIQVAYLNSMNHAGDNCYSFWMDAVRIYNPAEGNDTAEDAYVEDKENNPDYKTIRDILVDANALTENGSASGVVFIDGIESLSDVATYANPGPNNEAYLAYQQAIAFKLIATAQPTAVHIGAKLAFGEKATLMVGGNAFQTLTTATDMYYDLTDALTWTQNDNVWESDPIVLTNSTDGAVISLTNIKLVNAVFGTVPTDDTTEDGTGDETQDASVATVSVVSDATVTAAAFSVMRMLYAPVEEEVPVFEPEEFSANWVMATKMNRPSKLNILTSDDVAYVTVNGEVIENFRNNPTMSFGKHGFTIVNKYLWTYTETFRTAGTYSYEVIAYDENGVASEPIVVEAIVRFSNTRR